jgi:hypothetical protein
MFNGDHAARRESLIARAKVGCKCGSNRHRKECVMFVKYQRAPRKPAYDRQADIEAVRLETILDSHKILRSLRARTLPTPRYV